MEEKVYVKAIYFTGSTIMSKHETYNFKQYMIWQFETPRVKQGMLSSTSPFSYKLSVLV